MITANQIRAARALLGMKQAGLAQKAGLSLATIQRMEDAAIGTGRSSAENLAAVERALITAGVLFLARNGEGEGVRLRREG